MTGHPAPPAASPAAGSGTSAGTSATFALGIDHHGTTLPASRSLLDTIRELCDRCDQTQVLVLMAATLSNAGEIADAHGSHALQVVTAEVARRTLLHDHLQARLLRASPLGGFLVAAVVGRDRAGVQVEELLSAVRSLVDLPHAESRVPDRVWPVVTVGASVCRPDDVAAVVSEARSTLMAADRHSPGATRWHDGGSADHGDLALVRDLATALADDDSQLHLHYQPVYHLRGRGVVGAEALLRWHHPRRGVVSPMIAVDAAERTGLIVPLGRLVLERALTQAASWVPTLGPHFRMHVNVSPLELREPTYVEHLAATLRRTGVAPANVLLEITETALLSSEPTVQTTLEALRDLGVGIGIDDFGTGYSSIAHLQRMPIDTVKIDRSLVSGVAGESADYQTLRAVLGLVATLGVMVVAEGIENAVEAAHLRTMGCAFGQGYHLGRPVTAEAFLAGVLGTATHVATA